MKHHFQKSIYPILFLFLVFFCGCHSLPPSEPLGLETGHEFIPKMLAWEPTSLPSELTGDWYDQGKLKLTFAGDTLRMSGFIVLIETVSKSDTIYRIIYHVESNYNALYLRDLTGTQIQVAFTDSSATDTQGAAELPVQPFWQTLNTYNHWAAKIMPGQLAGNWHVEDGKLEIDISAERAVIDGRAWGVDSVTTNRIVDRLVLKSGQSYLTLFYRNLDLYTLEVLLVDGKVNSQEKEVVEQGYWIKLFKWWNFAKSLPLESGSRWRYVYTLRENYLQANWDSIPPDSSSFTNSFEGNLEIEVVSGAIGETTGQATLRSTFSIDEGIGRYLYFQKGDKIELVTDSSWSNMYVLVSIDHVITLENDSLWFQTEGGKVLFTSNKLQQDGEVNLRPFVYPFNFPRDGFPDGFDVIARIAFPGTISEDPEPERTGNVSYTYTIDIGEKYTVIKGFAISRYAFFAHGKGFTSVIYFHGAYDRGIWSGRVSRNPYVNVAKFNCGLISR